MAQSGNTIGHTRLIIVLSLIALFALLIIGKLFSLQIIHGQEFNQRADRQYAPSSDNFDRGKIYATAKDGSLVELASVTQGYKLAMVPNQVTDKEGTYAALAKIIPTLDHDEFITHAD